MIGLKHITKTYGADETLVRALDDVSFSVKKGGFAAIMGPSGSGKSTLMNILGCMDSGVSGEYSFFGRDVFSLSGDELCEIRNKMIGFVFQGFHLLPEYTAVENAALPLIYSGVPRAERERRAGELLFAVGLKGREYHTPKKLSGGQCQRVAIARALINDPDCILADEPTGNLDGRTGAEIMELLCSFNKQGKTVILITHSKEIAGYADERYFLRDGRLYADR